VYFQFCQLFKLSVNQWLCTHSNLVCLNLLLCLNAPIFLCGLFDVNNIKLLDFFNNIRIFFIYKLLQCGLIHFLLLIFLFLYLWHRWNRLLSISSYAITKQRKLRFCFGTFNQGHFHMLIAKWISIRNETTLNLFTL